MLNPVFALLFLLCALLTLNHALQVKDNHFVFSAAITLFCYLSLRSTYNSILELISKFKKKK